MSFRDFPLSSRFGKINWSCKANSVFIFPLIPRVQCLLHTSEDNRTGTTTLDDQVCGAAGLPSYRLEIPLRFYWVYIGFTCICNLYLKIWRDILNKRPCGSLGHYQLSHMYFGWLDRLFLELLQWSCQYFEGLTRFWCHQFSHHRHQYALHMAGLGFLGTTKLKLASEQLR